MLKLEQSSRNSGITVRLRERDRFFEPRLLKALALALFVHFGGLLLFQVTPFSFTSSFVFPPVKVQSSHPIQSISAVALSIPKELEEELAPPAPSLIPSLEIAYMPQESSLSPSLALELHVFQPLEERVWPFWELPLAFNLEEPRIRLTISGDLAERSLMATDPLLNQMQPINTSSSPLYVTYKVQMDESTGEIFWFEQLQSSGVKEVDRMMEKIIFNLRFAADGSFESAIGILNFVVLAENFSSRQI